MWSCRLWSHCLCACWWRRCSRRSQPTSVLAYRISAQPRLRGGAAALSSFSCCLCVRCALIRVGHVAGREAQTRRCAPAGPSTAEGVGRPGAPRRRGAPRGPEGVPTARLVGVLLPDDRGVPAARLVGVLLPDDRRERKRRPGRAARRATAARRPPSEKERRHAGSPRSKPAYDAVAINAILVYS